MVMVESLCMISAQGPSCLLIRRLVQNVDELKVIGANKPAKVRDVFDALIQRAPHSMKFARLR
jgi:hypothetical protein